MAVKAYPQDVRRPVEFTSELDLSGEEFTATVYDSEDNPTDVTSPNNLLGQPPGEDNIVLCDFSDLDPGLYYIVIHTEDLVVSKSILIMFSENGYDIS